MRARSALVAATAAIALLVPAAGPAAAAPAAASTADPVGGPRLTGTGVLVDLPPGVPAPPVVPAAAYVVADADTGAIVLARAPHVRHLPASTLKTLTALTLVPRLDPAAVHVATQDEVNVEGSKAGLVAGAPYTVAQLFRGLMLPSGNDAALALAAQAGGVPRTVALMQSEADRLQARDTVVRNPDGLDVKDQLTSAYDLALFGRAGLRIPAFRTLVATKRTWFPGRPVPGKPRPYYQLQNHNRLLWNYDGAIGIKNGYTIAARWTLVVAATRNGHTYLISELGITKPGWRYTAAVLDWAFAHGGQVRPVGTLVDPVPPGGQQGGASAAAADSTPAPRGAPARLASALGRTAAAGSLPGAAQVALYGAAGLAVLLLLLRVRVVVRRRRRRGRLAPPYAPRPLR